MSRKTAAFLALIVLGVSVASRGLAARDPLVDPTAQSLRGGNIDLEDPWTKARLLAHFGEVRLAYDVLGTRPYHTQDPQVGRFAARLLVEMGLVARADSVLALQPAEPGDAQAYLVTLWRARLNVLSGNYAGALGMLASLDTLTAPAFAPYKDFLALECLSKLERLDEACAIGESRMSQGVPLSLSPRFEESLLDAYMKSEKHEKALRFIDLLKARRNRPSSIAPVLIKEVDILFLAGDTARATSRAVELIHEPRSEAYAAELAESVVDRVAPAKLSEAQLLEFLRVLVEDDALAKADRLASVLSTRVLSPRQADELRLFSADLSFRERRYSKSFNLVQPAFTDAALERKASLLRARIARKTGRAEQSATAYVAFADKYPYDAKAAEALLVASELCFDLGQHRRGMQILDRIAKIYSSSRHGRTATMRMATYHFDRGEFADGIRILSAAVTRSHRSDEELLYYLADGYRRSGDQASADRVTAELRKLDSMSFYLDPTVDLAASQPPMASNGRVQLRGERGLLEFLKQAFEERVRAYESVRGALVAMRWSDESLDASERYLERGAQFLQMGFRDWAEFELKILESDYRLPARYSFELGILYDEFAMHWRSVRAFQGVYYAIPPESRVSLEREFALLLHPLPYPALVLENCAMGDMPPHLVYAMMRQESRFDLNAVSNAGAMGLMQLMPATGRQVAGKLGYPQGGGSLFVPEINLTLGIWYAAHLLSRADGDLLMMLAAYNAGLGNAKRWFRGSEGGPSVVAAVDAIDFGETRNYVKRIVETARVYHSFYFDTGADTETPTETPKRPE